MLNQLTPEQAFELCAYHGIEPFGEVREDLRMAYLLSSYVRANSKKGAKVPPLASFTLYRDLIESSEEQEGDSELMKVLAGFAEKSGG